MPFGPYRDFKDCVAKNSDKADPEAYCAVIERVAGASATVAAPTDRMRPMRLQIVPVFDDAPGGAEFVQGGDPAVILDVDGTLLSTENEPLSESIEYANELPGELFVVTGRTEDERDSTETALRDAGLRAFRLIMRSDETTDVPSHKKATAEALLRTYDVRLAVDNDPDSRAAYSELGIEAIGPDELEEVDMGNKGKKDKKFGSIEVEVEVSKGDEAEYEDPEDMEDEESESPETEIESEGEDFHALCVVEGVWTGDGRYIEEGALSWRDLPLPLMATDRTTEGHMNAVLVGQISRMERMGREIHAYGTYVRSEDAEVRKLQSLIRDKALRGISVDLDSVEYEVVVTPVDEMPEPIVDEEGNSVYSMDEMKMRVISARVMGATVVPFPAFQEAYIESIANLTASLSVRADVSGWISDFASYSDIDFQPPKGAQEEAALGLKWREEYGRGGTEVGVARARDISNGKNLSPDTVNRMVSYFARHEVDKQGQGWSPGEDGFPSAGRIAWALWGGDPGRTWANKVKEQMSLRDSSGSIVASGHPIAAPIVPPSSWFSNPKLGGPTPLTVDDDGRIYGHLAVWGQCHMGFGDRCIQPPHSPANYAHFLTGEILCDDGLRIPVGQITMNAGHASHQATAAQAARHYDNTASAAADVTAGEDEYGIWVAGAMRSTLAPAEIRALMASDVSGDWRRIGGALELVAVLAVNVPGFPKIRVRETEGLVASLSLPAFDGAPRDRGASMDAVRQRIAASIGRSKTDRIAEIVKRVKGK